MMRNFTPLRYPGGKAKLFNKISKIIEENFNEPPIYIEAFAGGSGLALKLLLEGYVSEIHINDLDYAIYSFWFSIINHKEEFVQMMKDTEVSVKEWRRQKSIYQKKNDNVYSILEIGFSTFYLNRTNRSGILKAGPIGGYNQEGNYKLNCRFNKEKLIEIIEKIYDFRENIYIYNLDAIDFINIVDKQYDNAFIYLDPPYVNQGHNLYLNALNHDDHRALKLEVDKLQNKWFITYDNVSLIKDIYSEYDLKEFYIHYSANVKRNEVELAIYSNELHISENIL